MSRPKTKLQRVESAFGVVMVALGAILVLCLLAMFLFSAWAPSRY